MAVGPTETAGGDVKHGRRIHQGASGPAIGSRAVHRHYPCPPVLGTRIIFFDEQELLGRMRQGGAFEDELAFLRMIVPRLPIQTRYASHASVGKTVSDGQAVAHVSRTMDRRSSFEVRPKSPLSHALVHQQDRISLRAHPGGRRRGYWQSRSVVGCGWLIAPRMLQHTTLVVWWPGQPKGSHHTTSVVCLGERPWSCPPGGLALSKLFILTSTSSLSSL